MTFNENMTCSSSFRNIIVDRYDDAIEFRAKVCILELIFHEKLYNGHFTAIQGQLVTGNVSKKKETL